ncbi:MAG: hypothetical protein ABIK09_00710 [Pseudomonadota bacterium]
MLLLVLAGCIDHTVGHGGGGVWQLEGAGIAVVGTDYLSTSVSILAPGTGALLAEGVIHSGSAAPGLSLALSGDVTLPASPNPLHQLFLLDRFPNSVITILDGVTFEVLGQVPVGTGFAANPHDLLWLDPGKVYVTRYETNPTPGRAPFDGGDDLLIVDPEAATVTGRIPLGDQADPGLLARPERMVLAGDRVWVVLGHLAADFKGAGPGRLVAVDPLEDAVDLVLDLPGVENCTGLVHLPARDRLYVACAGLFDGGRAAQLEGAGLVVVDLAVSPPEANLLRGGADAPGGAFAFDLTVADGRWLLGVRFGDLAAGTPDRLVAMDLDGDREDVVIHEAGSAFGIGGVLADDVGGFVLVGDADPAAPRLLRFRVDGGAFTPDGEIRSHPSSGLPPRHLAFY